MKMTVDSKVFRKFIKHCFFFNENIEISLILNDGLLTNGCLSIPVESEDKGEITIEKDQALRLIDVLKQAWEQPVLVSFINNRTYLELSF